MRRANFRLGRGLLLSLTLGLHLASSGCARVSTPESACEAFLGALSEGDAGAAFDNLIQSTQWAFATVHKNQRRMRELIESSYPPGEQAAALARLYGADADSPRDLWGRVYNERYVKTLVEYLGEGAIKVTANLDRPAERLCQREGKKAFRLARAASGRWGIADFDAEWEQAQLRAVHDLDTIQKNADLYKRVSAPQK